MDDLREALSVARAAVDAACRVLTAQYERYFGDDAQEKLKTHTKSSPIDMVTEVDTLAQQAIIDVIQKKYPEHRFIAEEDGAEELGNKDSPYAWIIDPLDGTMNFIHGRDNFGTIVALQGEGGLLAAAMAIPLRGRTFYGSCGGGAFFNGKPVKLRQTKSMDDAILSSNAIRRAKKLPDGTLTLKMPQCGSMENYGSAVDEIGHVLMGWTDGAFFQGISFWDVAAGLLLVEEAGGRTYVEFQQPGNPRSPTKHCLMCTAPIYEELYEFVTKKMS